MKNLVVLPFFNNNRSLFDVIGEDSFFNFPHMTQTYNYWKKDKDSSSYQLKIDLPGIAKSDLKIEAIDGIVKVSAKTETRNYQYTLSVPKDLDIDSLDATLNNGELTLKAKNKVKENTKLIEVK